MIKKAFSTGLLIFLMIVPSFIFAQSDDGFRIARVQYRGGGDWYNVPSSLTNLIEFTKNQVPINIQAEYDDVQLGSRDIFNLSLIHI